MTSILLIEDTVDLSTLIQRELETAGYQVFMAADGVTALEQFQKCQPDLLILDWRLPKIDGLEVLRRIRVTSPTPVLMLTARSDETDQVVGLGVGADDYLTKPFSMRELIARVHALLRRSDRIQQMMATDRSESKERLQQGGLNLNPRTFEAFQDGRLLELSRTEFALLHLFLRNPGRVFSRTYLLETVWGESYITGDRSVDNVILRLRKKLGEFGETIETVWGVGYRFRRDR